MDKCIEVSDWKGYAARKKASKENGKLRGRAVSYYIEFGGIFNERMDLRFDPGGTLTIMAGTHSHGQGHATVFAQLVHEWLGVPFESIRYVQGDTAQVAIGRGTYGARSAIVGGNALPRRTEAIIEKGKPMAAALMEADAADLEFKDGSYRVVGTDKAIAIVDVAKAAYAPMGPLTVKFGVGLEATGSFSAEPPSHPNGSHVCELEVDPETGEVSIDRYFVVDDLGRVLNPMIVRGQIHGGVVAGHRPGADRASDLRPQLRAAPHRQLHGLRHAARRHDAGDRDPRSRRCRARPIRSASRASANPAPSARRRP